MYRAQDLRLGREVVIKILPEALARNHDRVARIARAQVPFDSSNFHAILYPDGKWLGMPLTDGTTSHLWMLSATGGPLRQVTDFGRRSILIVRRISWSPDSEYIYAAVAESDADVVLLDGLIP